MPVERTIANFGVLETLVKFFTFSLDGSMMKIVIKYIIFMMLLGCGPSRSHHPAETSDDAEEKPSRLPTERELLRSIGAGYTLPAGAQQECIGRLIVEVGRTVQWPTYVGRNSTSLFDSQFSEGVFDQGDGIAVQNVSVAVIGPTTPSLLGQVLSDTPWGTIEEYRELIAKSSAYLRTVEGEKPHSPRTSRFIVHEEESIRTWQRLIGETEAKYEVISFPFPESQGFWKSGDRNADGSPSESTYRAYLTRGDYVYVFESLENLKDGMTKERHKQQFIDTVRRFRPRKPGEIPSGLGVCFPHGFIADDGKMITDIKQSLRWPDAPGVIYAIQTGNSTTRNSKNAMITALGTAAAAKTALSGEGGETAVLTHQVGPVLTKIGELPASQGGFALRISTPGREPFEVYDVFTGYSGWRGVPVLPFILIEMSTRTTQQAPELTTNPPPFKQSMDRLQTLLKSARLRPTTPLMPGLAALREKK
jgi:hypothetical protein